MSRFKDRAQVRQFVEQQITPRATRGLKGYALATKTMLPLMDKIDKAIAAADADAAKLHSRRLNALRNEAQRSLTELAETWEQIDVLIEDDGAEARQELAAIDPLVKKILAAKGTLNDIVYLAGASVEKADKFVADAARGEAAAWVHWSRIMAVRRQRADTLKRSVARATDALKRASAARQARDAVMLAMVQQEAKASAAEALELTFDDLRKAINAFLARFDPESFSPQFRSQIDRESKELGALAARAQPLVLQVVQIQREIERMSIEPPDPASVGRELGVPPKLHGQLKKALHQNGSGLVKALDEIGRQAGLETGGREMVAKLKRAKLVA